MTGWFLLIVVVGLSAHGTDPVGFAKDARMALPFETEEACRDFVATHEPIVDFGEQVAGVFWSCWENPPPFGGDGNG